MNFNNKLPEWKNSGTEPSTSLKTTGFQGGMKPPADIFNWFWSKVISAITELQDAVGLGLTPIVEATSTDGVAYTATVNGIESLYDGLKITIIPDMQSTSTAVTLNVNGLGDKKVRMTLPFNTVNSGALPTLENWMAAGSPLTLTYHSKFETWKTELTRQSASALYGTVPITSGGTGADNADEARTNLGITPENIGAAKSDLSNVTGAKIKTYTSLAQIGLSIGGETIGGLFNSLPSGSMIMYYPTYQYRKDVYPDYGETNRVGMFIAYKPTSTYMYVMFTRSGNSSNYVQQWVGNYSSTNSFSGWKEVTIANDGTVTSPNADYAEVGEWADGNESDEDRIGYFVAIDDATEGATMVKATAQSDVRGVTVAAPAFSGNCAANKFDAEGNLLKQYDYVAVMGLVSVIDNGTCTVNERCMPANDGTAIPSTNNMGYQVIKRIDSTHVLIGVEPSADMLNRIKTSVTGLETGKANKATITAETMLASAWSNGKYSFESAYPAATYDIEIALDSTATSAQAEAFNGAQIVGSATSNVVKAYGDVPSVDIPICIKAVMK